MFTKIKEKLHAIWLPEGLKDIKTSNSENASFLLVFQDLNIGMLTFNGKEWIFKYSNEFQQQDKYQPLIIFPNIQKEYRSKELWPFFVTRIPSVKQPEMKAYLKSTGKNEKDNLVDLLRKFGYRTITNPFLLKPQI